MTLSPHVRMAAICLLLLQGTAPAERHGTPSHELTRLVALPPALTLPVSLPHTLRAGKTPAATALDVTTTQRILLPGGLYLQPGAHLRGTIVRSDARSPTLSLHFATFEYRGQTLPISVRCLAIANITDVSDTRLPASQATDRGNSDPANWTTAQVGGDEVVRSGWSGDVINRTSQTVGFANYYGVYALPRSPGEIPRALGVFSTTAKGLYGLSADCSLEDEASDTTIHCTSSKLALYAGDNLLLEVIASP